MTARMHRVLNGAVGEMHAGKIAGIYDMAMKMGAPVIGFIDCAGFRLQEATDALEAFGKIYQKQSYASGVIPQITAVFGMCGGGLAVIPGLTDFTFMEAGKGKLFVNSPNAIPGTVYLRMIHLLRNIRADIQGWLMRSGQKTRFLKRSAA